MIRKWYIVLLSWMVIIAKLPIFLSLSLSRGFFFPDNKFFLLKSIITKTKMTTKPNIKKTGSGLGGGGGVWERGRIQENLRQLNQELLHIFFWFNNIPLVEGVLWVEYGEHALVEMAEELSQRLLQVHVPVLVVGLQVLEEVRENVRVPLVEDAVGLLEHEVKVPLGVGQQLREKFCKIISLSLFAYT